MIRALRIAALAASALCASHAAAAACPPPDRDEASLVALKAADFNVTDPVAREAMAFALVECLASPASSLRDGIAYEGLRRWLRAEDFAPATLRALRARLFVQLDASDPDGVVRPFAALALSELARTDRIDPWMRPDEREAMVVRAATYLESVRDYRGFDVDVGWRHGVAHGADWAMQLALNPALDRMQLDRLRQAVAAQAVPASGHAYVYGESERLARPLLFIAKRDLHDEADWSAWFAALSTRLGDPALAWKDADWLARRHDLTAFLQSLYLQVDLGDDPGMAKMKPGLVAALKALP